jgi:hypothetical protein
MTATVKALLTEMSEYDFELYPHVCDKYIKRGVDIKYLLLLMRKPHAVRRLICVDAMRQPVEAL